MDSYTLDMRDYIKRLTAAEGERREPMFPDPYLEYWGRVHVALQLYRRFRIRFDAFVLHPEQILEALRAQGAELYPPATLPRPIDSADHAPLLPAQQLLAERLEFAEGYEEAAERGLESLPRRNGTIVEPLSHRAWPRRGQANFRRRSV